MARFTRVLAVAALLTGCGGEAKEVVSSYVAHLHAGRYEQAYSLVSAAKKKELSLEEWKQAMHTDRLADVQDFSVQRHTFTSDRACLQTQLDFASRDDAGPLGFYIFYLVREGQPLRIQDVLTYTKIDGMFAEFDESREPFSCHRGRL